MKFQLSLLVVSLALLGCQRDESESTGRSVGLEIGRATASDTNAVSRAGGLDPGTTLIAGKGLPTSDGRFIQGELAVDDALTERIRLALIQPAAGAAGAVSAQVSSETLRSPSVPTVSDLAVSSSDGTVTLRGQVMSDIDRVNVESRVRQVLGVSNIINRLEVRRP